MNLLIPMAGRGNSFASAGCEQTKALIPVRGKAMIHRVVANLHHPNIKFIFVMLQEHAQQYRIDQLLNQMLKYKCEVLLAEEVTEGPAATCLLAKEYINNDDPLCIVYADQMIEDLNWSTFGKFMEEKKYADGAIGTFESLEPTNGHIQIDEYGWVTEVREREIISNVASNGLYYWKQGKYFVQSAERMIEVNDRTDGEFYVAPTFNYLIDDGKKITTYPFSAHFSIGTPEDLKLYEEYKMRQ